MTEYRRDLLEKWPRNPSMCTHLPMSRYGSTPSSWARAARSRVTARRRVRWGLVASPPAERVAALVEYFAR